MIFLKQPGVNVEVTMGGEIFKTSGLAIEERNYLDVYIYDKWTGNTIPDLRLGDVITPSSLMMNKGKTRAPQPMVSIQKRTLFRKM